MRCSTPCHVERWKTDMRYRRIVEPRRFDFQLMGSWTKVAQRDKEVFGIFSAVPVLPPVDLAWPANWTRPSASLGLPTGRDRRPRLVCQLDETVGLAWPANWTRPSASLGLPTERDNVAVEYDRISRICRLFCRHR